MIRPNYMAQASDLLRKSLPVSDARKIVCLSLPKGGTTSFHKYLDEAGLKVVGAGPARKPVVTDHDFSRFVNACKIRLVSDGFQEWPWCFFAELFREKFPETRFVTFTRPFEDWYKSFQFHLAKAHEVQAVMRQFVGSKAGEAEYRAFYEAHYANSARATEGGHAIVLGLDEPDDAKRDKLNAFLSLSVESYGHDLAREKRLRFQVRQALARNATEAEAILTTYRGLYGEDDAARKASAMIAKAGRKPKAA